MINILLFQILVSTIYRKILKQKKKKKKKKKKKPAPLWSDKFELPNGSYSVLDNQDYF